MNKSLFILSLSLAMPVVAQPVVTVPAEGAKVSLTIAQDDNALVSDRRRVTLAAGRSTLRFPNVSPLLEDTGTTVQPAFSDGVVEVLEQQFRFDTKTPGKAIARYTGLPVSVIDDHGKQLNGNLTRTESGWILENAEGFIADPRGTFILPKLADGLVTSPSLEWLVNAPKAGTYGVEARYPTPGLRWLASYRATLAPDGNHFTLRGWLEVINRSGADYRDATLQLQTGKLNTNSAAFPYPRPVTLPRNETRQLGYAATNELAASTELAVQFSGGRLDRDVTLAPTLSLRLKNDAAAGLGLPLPEGSLTVWRQSASGALSYMSTGTFPQLPVGDEVLLPLEVMNDINVTRAITTRQLNPRVTEHTLTFTTENKRPIPVILVVRDTLVADAKITGGAQPERRDGNILQFRVEVPAKGKTDFKYTIQIGGQ